MIEKKREEIANQRFSLIAPIIKHPTEVMSRGHRYELLRQISTGYDLSTGIQIFLDGQQYKDAIPAKIHRHSKKGFNQEHLEVVPSSGLNFLEQLAQEELTVKKAMNFSALGGTEP